MVGLFFTLGGDDVIPVWGGALLLVLWVAGVVDAASPVRRVFISGAWADFSEPSFEALLFLLAEGELTGLLLSVSVSD